MSLRTDGKIKDRVVRRANKQSTGLPLLRCAGASVPDWLLCCAVTRRAQGDWLMYLFTTEAVIISFEILRWARFETTVGHLASPAFT